MCARLSLNRASSVPRLPTSSAGRARRLLSSSHAPSALSAPSMEGGRPAGKEEGSVAAVFASLSGQKRELPARFAELRSRLVRDATHARTLERRWREVLESLRGETARIESQGAERLIPHVDFPSEAEAAKGCAARLEEWTDAATLDQVRKAGVVVVRNVVPEALALSWKQRVRDYVAANPGKTRGFPEGDPQVYELYWSKAQLEARGHPSVLAASQALLSLWHPGAAAQSADSPTSHLASLRQPLTYADRLRIRMPGDARFSLGAHVDGGGVERWEDACMRRCWQAILGPPGDGGDVERRHDWRSHDAWSLGPESERLRARTDMYGGAGACSVFRPWQGWLSLSHTSTGEGTLRVLPLLTEATAYIVLRPLFRPRVPREAFHGSSTEAYLSPENWRLDVDPSRAGASELAGCSLGHNLELDEVSHPHLRLSRTMVSVPRVAPGDFVAWHCDLVHAVESRHAGPPGRDSSVMYVPAIPLTKANFQYVRRQSMALRQGVPPEDFPGGAGESAHVGRGIETDVVGEAARRAMGLERFALDREGTDATPSERRLLQLCNGLLSG